MSNLAGNIRVWDNQLSQRGHSAVICQSIFREEWKYEDVSLYRCYGVYVSM